MVAVEETEQGVTVAPVAPITRIPSTAGLSSSITGLSKGVSSSVTGLGASVTELPSSVTEILPAVTEPKPSIPSLKGEHPIALEIAVVKKIRLLEELEEIKSSCTLNLRSLHNIRPDLRDYVVLPNQTKTMEYIQRDGNLVKWDDTQYMDKVEDASHTLKMQFDVSHYTPEDVKVVIADGILRILAMHEEKSENQRTKRQYRREFLLPKGINPYQVTATISLDGVLTVEAPLPIDEVTDLDESPAKCLAQKPSLPQKQASHKTALNKAN